MLSWLETTALAQWVALSLWAYPMLLALHITGLAVVVGVFFMRDLVLVGLVKGPEPVDFILPVRLAFAGFLLNAVSGALLFVSQATVFAASKAFQAKMLCIFLGLLLAWRLQRRLAGRATELDKGAREQVTAAETAGGGTTQLLAGASLLCWVLAITAGRLIAYLG